MHGYAALDPSTSVGVANDPKQTELETCQGLRSNRLRLGLYRLEATQRSVVRVQEVFLHPCHVANVGVGQRPTVLTSPLGARSRGMCQRHSFKGL